MDIKIALSIVGGLFIAGSFIPYIRDILKDDAEPHVYTWFIWTFTQVIVALAIIQGNGGTFAALSIATGAILSGIIFLLSLRHYNKKDVTTFDSVTFVIALLAILIWWKLNHPELAVIAITTVDILGFLPTLRKSWQEPESEPLIAWVLFTIGNIAALLALTQYNLMTSFYIVSMIIASFILSGIIFFRDQKKSF